jgi:hypothetical protein
MPHIAALLDGWCVLVFTTAALSSTGAVLNRAAGCSFGDQEFSFDFEF